MLHYNGLRESRQTEAFVRDGLASQLAEPSKSLETNCIDDAS
jgi:hypothetical protein